ncbi:MAG: NAD-dependent malic enzyme [Acidimicrobiia bacterium]|nr:NAD-dependent malic enzyme [Acidimicrobiia bacterium]NNJ46671.1 NAD-dependent malic enzyme [Acidimicrobiia bacterium]NNL13604.1 NAD-dependent malic enzyme [Acidimicrobiia bacterium]
MHYSVKVDPDTSQRYLAVSVRGQDLLKDSLLNKGTAFTEEERDAFGLRGLLPDHVSVIDSQLDRVRTQLDLKPDPIQKNIYLSGLQDRNETLFYRFLIENLEEAVPLVYTPVVAEACRHWSRLYRRARGVFITPKDRGRITTLLRSRPTREPGVIVVTDNERILGIGDQGAGGMGIPIGKLALYTAGAGIHPANTFPISLDVGTNNEELLNDPLYLGLHEPRLRGDDYWSLIDEFVEAVTEVFPHSLLQWEDFGNKTSFRNLDRYRDRLASFNDDIEGTAATVVAGLLVAMRELGTSWPDQRIVIAGAGSAGIGLARTITAAMRGSGMTEADARSRIYLTDSKSLVNEDRTDITEEKRVWAVERERMAGWGVTGSPVLAEVVRNVHPTVLIGLSGQAGLFGKEMIRDVADAVERPLIMPMSNPTNCTEVLPADALDWTEGRAIIATGSPFEPVVRDGRIHQIGQANNMYIFPAMGLGTLAVQASRVTDGMFLAAAETLADAVDPSLSAAGALFPRITDVREVSRALAVAVGQQAIAEGVADEQEDVGALVDDLIWFPEYIPFRPA